MRGGRFQRLQPLTFLVPNDTGSACIKYWSWQEVPAAPHHLRMRNKGKQETTFIFCYKSANSLCGAFPLLGVIKGSKESNTLLSLCQEAVSLLGSVCEEKQGRRS